MSGSRCAVEGHGVLKQTVRPKTAQMATLFSIFILNSWEILLYSASSCSAPDILLRLDMHTQASIFRRTTLLYIKNILLCSYLIRVSNA